MEERPEQVDLRGIRRGDTGVPADGQCRSRGRRFLDFLGVAEERVV